jgi:hypothetical protein
MLPVAAAIMVAMLGASSASATTINYSGESVSYGDTVQISSPNNISGVAGQITLTGVTGLGASTTSLLAWCLDVYDYLLNKGSFTGAGPLANESNLIGGLMQEGNNDITAAKTHGNSLSLGGHTYSLNDISAATQIAIWSVEYSGFTYKINGSNPTSSFTSLVSYLENNATPNVAYWTLNERGNQTLGTLSPVPGPIVGAGLPGLVTAGIGLLGWWRRKRNAVVA